MLSYDDEAATSGFECPPTKPGTFIQPSGGALSVFDDQPAAGTFRIRLSDVAGGDGGRLNSFSLKVCQEGASLPVTFTSFRATPAAKSVLLSWTTSDERDNAGFHIERSTDIGGSWQTLDFVAAGTPYTFTDFTVAPATRYLYRLRQEDYDGRFRYSELRDVRTPGNGTDSTLDVFPNPSAGRFTVRWPSPLRPATSLSYRLRTLDGRLLRSGSWTGPAQPFDLSGLPTGTYQLVIVGSDHVRQARLLLR